MDLFWIYQENIIIECLIHLLNMSKIKLIRMNEEEMMVYIQKHIVEENVLRFGLSSCLPFSFNK